MYYLTEQEVYDAFHDDEKDAKLLFEPYDEIERLAANKPKDKLPDGFPKVTDGSLASDLRKIPKEYLSQLFTGNISSTNRNESWVAEFANIVWAKHIVPNANYEDLFLNKQLDWGYRANKYGSQPMLAFLSVTDTYKGANCALPYIRNVILERGKVSDLAANRCYLVQYYDKYTIKSIIDEAEKEEKLAKDKKRKSYNQWDVKQLKLLLESSTSKKEQHEQNKTERDYNLNTGAYKIIHCFQRGFEAPFYSFAPALGAEDNIVRRTQNTNPTGDMPIIFQYTDIERENPYGLGVAALAAPNQNVQDTLTQAHMFGTFYGFQPAIQVGGSTAGLKPDTLVMKPRKLMYTGQADVKPFQMATGFYESFPNAIGLYKTQQQKLIGARDGAVSASAGDPQFSKTSAGVKENVRSNNVDGDFLTKRHEQAYERLVTTMVNLHMANMEGSEVLKITQDEGMKLDMAGAELDKDGNGVITSDEILIEYEKLRGRYKFEVDANSSKEKNDTDDADEMASMVETIQGLAQLPPEIPFGEYTFKTGEYASAILRKKGIPDIDKFLVKLTPEEMQGQDMGMGGQQPGTQLSTRALQLMQAHSMAPQLAQRIADMEAQGVDPRQIIAEVQQMGVM